MKTQSERSYHHGNLREALLAEALRVITDSGPDALSLRELARRLGVSHAAPAHHFADKLSLLTAIAAQGFEWLADGLEQAASEGFLEVGLAYVRFAVEHPAHLNVMYHPALFRTDDLAIAAARWRASKVLFETAAEFRPEANARQVGLAGWSLMHGLAMLWLGGNLDQVGQDPVSIARWLGQATFGRDGAGNEA